MSESSRSSSSVGTSRSSSTPSLPRPINNPCQTPTPRRSRTTSTSDSGGGSSSTRSSSTPRNSSSGSLRTPRLSSGSVNGVPEPSAIVAVVEGRGLAKGEVGIACIDLKKPELLLSQFSDGTTYVKVFTKLQILNPKEILMPNTACESGSMTKLFQVIGDQLPNVTITAVQRRYFNEAKGLQYVRHLCLPEFNSVEVQVASKYYCLSTAAALLKYIEFTESLVYAPNSLKIVFSGSERTCVIDAHTARFLELIVNLQNPKSDHSLYGVLHHTQTAGGSRLLRASLLQPLCDEHTINARLDCVDEIAQSETMFYSLQEVLQKFVDVDHLLSLCIQIPKQESLKIAEEKITQVLQLKHVLELVEPLKNTLADCRHPLLKAFKMSLEDPHFREILYHIGRVIQEEVKYQKGALPMRAQKCFAVKPNVNGLLDIARRSYCEIVDDITEMVKQLSEEHSLPIRIAFNVTRGFFVQVNLANKELLLDQLPAMFIKKSRFKSTISFTTEDVIKMNDRVRESLNEIYLMSNVIVSELLAVIRDKIGCLYKLAEAVSMLDLFTGFAESCTLSQYVRPDFTDTLAVKRGRHPILEKITFDAAVANNTYLSQDTNLMIITGPNMSGKSTYLKQVALLQIMAQTGSFVPAEYASFRIADSIFTRLGSDDDIETNASTFMLEMREANYIIQNVSDTSLVIIDELGRGTSVEEGIGVCHAICEHLLTTKAFVILATHFMELTQLETLYPNVLNYHFEVNQVVSNDDEDTVRLDYTHSLTKAVSQEEDYGLKLAEVSLMPPAVVEDAKEMAQKMRREHQRSINLSPQQRHQRAAFNLAARLVQVAKNSRLDPATLLAYTESLREEYACRMSSSAQRTSDTENSSQS